ncbi:aspartate aminotransferase family protein [Streptomyces sp. CoH17]|uniref:aspartate aminotransferase family protein n=1 Tax=Streptomyces sp. CoH17 TaxID=2992806 RepID=UPI002270D579|nr:aspartate aminotransferase family protein [Streptomyces sp. CoH17]
MSYVEGFKDKVAQTSPFSLALEVESASGSYIYTAGGKSYLDFTSGMSVNNAGHRNPYVMASIEQQLKNYLHTTVYGEHVQRPQVTLADKLTKRYAVNHEDYQVFFTNSGTEATELALKMARKTTGREKFVALRGGFHGRTFGSMSVSWNEKYKKGFGKLFECQFIEPGNYDDLNFIEWDDVAGVIVEIVQGESGAVKVEPAWLQSLHILARSVGAKFIVDEVQTGVYRTGPFFAQHGVVDVLADFTTIGKAVGGGMPIGGVIAKKEDFEELQNPPFSHVTTYGGHPVSCAAGLGLIEYLEQDDRLERIGKNAKYFEECLDNLVQYNRDKLASYSGAGFLRALHFHSSETVEQFVKNMHSEYRILLGYKLNSAGAVRLSPPLTVTSVEIEKFFDAASVVLQNLST